jgi:valyl-tRNA synthetase
MLDKTYTPQDIESSIYSKWENAGFFKPSYDSSESFSIVIPPPNVTGILHLGHALNMTLQDTITRYNRMKGINALWLPGSDHAGIATQNVVEKKLALEGTSRFDIGREDFVKKVWEWKNEYGSRITAQIRRLGASVDWSRERFTMDQGCADAVRETFVSLYDRGLIYQGKYIINWCPRCHTALSDIEVIHEEKQGHLWVIQYPHEDNEEKNIIVATTRPETMFGDTAVAVHPDDERYKNLIGKKVRIPLTKKYIPIIADSAVDIEFGTGAVKVTPAHDMNDFEIGKRHDLERVLVINESGTMNENVPKQFIGLDRHECRKKLVQELIESGHLIETKDHDLSIGHCYRCNTIIEPYLSKQWFVSMKELAGPAIDVVKSGKINFSPKRWEKIYFDWMESIRDWCISRQIWWGHRIPVWYCQDHLDKPIVSKKTPTNCPICNSTDLKQDEDVLDTWFSSALWPFSTLGWPEKTKDLETFFPTTVLVTAYDILTFWVSRMITMSLAQTKQIPFSTVYIHGLVRDAQGKKMSKSLGNALDPLGLIDEFGADALRFSLASLSTLGGQDIKFTPEKIQSARNFANKIWNVTRFIMMILEESENKIDINNLETDNGLAEEWILSSYNSLLESLNENYAKYNYAQACDDIWDFTWNKFCDWYVEISKIDKEKSLPILIYILVNLLKTMHPTMPFITEEIWQKLAATKKINLEAESIMQASWPKVQESLIKPEAESKMEFLIKLTREIRNMRKQLNIALGKQIDLTLVSTDIEKDTIHNNEAIIKKLAKVNNIELLSEIKEKPKQSSASVAGNTQIYISLQGLIDIDEEKTRLQKKLSKLEADLTGFNKKLSNENFLAKAPQDVIKKLQDRQKALSEEKKLLDKQLINLA